MERRKHGGFADLSGLQFLHANVRQRAGQLSARISATVLVSEQLLKKRKNARVLCENQQATQFVLIAQRIMNGQAVSDHVRRPLMNRRRLMVDG